MSYDRHEKQPLSRRISPQQQQQQQQPKPHNYHTNHNHDTSSFFIQKLPVSNTGAKTLNTPRSIVCMSYPNNHPTIRQAEKASLDSQRIKK
jgi:hypothetical protein